ncbi:MAG: amylo-alpha-1,6-glucosidase, partial [Bacteroidales bacterium]
PVPAIDEENHVLLSSLDETVIQHGAEFNLGLHKYDGDHYSPNGHKYIREFSCDVIPKTIYRVGGVILSKEKIFISHENRILIKYTLLEAHSPTTLRLKPFLAFRSVRMLTHENDQINKEYLKVENGICTSLYKGYPLLFMQLSKKNEFVYHPDWYKGIEYIKEQERGYYSNEDLYVPGYFEFPIKKGESVYFSAGLNEVPTKTYKNIFIEEEKKRTPRDSFYNCLKNSAQQFYNRKEDNSLYLLAGYPWFKVRARDLFVSLPGCTLSIDQKDKFYEIMDTSIPALKKYMESGNEDPVIKEIYQPDVLLWAIWAIQQLYKEDKEVVLKKYASFVLEIIDFIRKNNHENLKLETNGLLSSDGTTKAISWMNSTSGGHPIVPRTGYLVEFNALWYNALCFASELASSLGEEERHDKFIRIAEKTGISFMYQFKNPHGYLYDYIDGDHKDLSVRPNMLFTLAFDYSPLSKEEKKNCLDYVTKELLTPKGIRSLSPKSSGYNPFYQGPQVQRDYAYHQGTAWPWLTGFYLEAYLKIYKQSGISFVERALIGFEDEMRTHCVGTIAELFDGNPPFKARGAISFAMNVAEILRIMKIINKYEEGIL